MVEAAFLAEENPSERRGAVTLLGGAVGLEVINADFGGRVQIVTRLRPQRWGVTEAALSLPIEEGRAALLRVWQWILRRLRRGNGELVEVQSELKNAVESAVEQLPETYRSVFVLREIEQLSTAETAECLNLSEEAVKTRLHRSRALLRRDLQAPALGLSQADVAAALSASPLVQALTNLLDDTGDWTGTATNLFTALQTRKTPNLPSNPKVLSEQPSSTPLAVFGIHLESDRTMNKRRIKMTMTHSNSSASYSADSCVIN